MNGWELRYDTWSPEAQGQREALCTLGNGHFATRGAFEEARAGPVHYPGTYLAGGYDRSVTEVGGELLESEDLVNWPNWLPITFRPEGGEWLDLERFRVDDFEVRLDLRDGLLRRRVEFTDREGRRSRLEVTRLVSMADAHLAAIRWHLSPLDWHGPLLLRWGLDGSVTNDGVARYRALGGHHLSRLHAGVSQIPGIWLTAESAESRLRMAQVARGRVEGRLETRRARVLGDRVFEEARVEVGPGLGVTLEKVVALHTSRDLAAHEPLSDACRSASRAGDFATLVREHAKAWHRLWNRCDLELGQDGAEAVGALRLNVFHLMQVVSPHIVDRDVGVPARGLHGEAYRGHVFWDELFIFPFFTYTWPTLTRELLLYRHRRLEAARWNARTQGYRGALFPWQSGSTGREESQHIHLNPRSGRWLPDETRLQRHIGAAVAFNVWQYWRATGDHDFLGTYGAEILIEVARFYASAATWDPDLERYRVRGVVGPDEYHTRYPGAETPGIDDNAYTNIMASWTLRCAEEALQALDPRTRKELTESLTLTHEEQRTWATIARRLYVPFHDDHLISQFHGYADLEEFDWDGYRARYGDIQRLDRVLEAEGDTPNRYKASKQADVLMLLYLFSAEELVGLLGDLGYRFDPAWIPENVDYYQHRTSHGSTLSRVVHSWVLSRGAREGSWQLFLEALRSDLGDIQGGTTAEGIHLGAMAGSVDLLQRGYLGAFIRDGVLWLSPRLPRELPALTTTVRVGGAAVRVRVDTEAIEVQCAGGWAPAAQVAYAGQVFHLAQGEHRRLTLPAGP